MILKAATAACFVAAGLVGGPAGPARADHRPVLFVDPLTGVPLEVREGDWGLYRPGAPPRHVYPLSPHDELPPARAYFPATGTMPHVGRDERERPRRRRAQTGNTTFYRAWSASSFSAPADLGPPAGAPPTVIVEPRIDPQWRASPQRRRGPDAEGR